MYSSGAVTCVWLINDLFIKHYHLFPPPLFLNKIYTRFLTNFILFGNFRHIEVSSATAFVA